MLFVQILGMLQSCKHVDRHLRRTTGDRQISDDALLPFYEQAPFVHMALHHLQFSAGDSHPAASLSIGIVTL